MTREELEALLALEGKKLNVERGFGYCSVMVYDDRFDYEYEIGSSEQDAINHLVRVKYKLYDANN